MSNRQVETIKAMLSRQKDKARLAYGRTTTEMPRQFIIIGTSNDRKYLRDVTGNDRFWPVLSHASIDRPIDTEGFRKIVRLLWGEASARERAGESIYLTPDQVKLAHIEQNKRFDGDENYEALEAALEGKEGFVLNDAVFEICGIEPGAARKRAQNTKPIRNAMTKLGWEPAKRTIRKTVDAFGQTLGHDETTQVRGYVKGNVPDGVLKSWWQHGPGEGVIVAVIKGMCKHENKAAGSGSG